MDSVEPKNTYLYGVTSDLATNVVKDINAKHPLDGFLWRLRWHDSYTDHQLADGRAGWGVAIWTKFLSKKPDVVIVQKHFENTPIELFQLREHTLAASEWEYLYSNYYGEPAGKYEDLCDQIHSLQGFISVDNLLGEPNSMDTIKAFASIAGEHIHSDLPMFFWNRSEFWWQDPEVEQYDWQMYRELELASRLEVPA